ncbi:hypothetical protein HK096_003207 [Nowakowskiella sp. JEL0078]|nr:hypothetical protein HK096_003207 [Nowakowskiella sp. JEL0078]
MSNEGINIKNKKADVIILPSHEAVSQVFLWIKTVLSSEPIRSAFPALDEAELHKFYQIHRNESNKTIERNQLNRLDFSIPKIMLVTPKRFYELQSKGHINHKNIRTIVLDEADEILTFTSRYANSKKIYYAKIHPTPGDLLIRDIVAYRNLNFTETPINIQIPEKKKKLSPIQIIIMSATLNSVLRNQIISIRKWVLSPMIFDTGSNLIPPGIDHYCYTVSENTGVYNLLDENLLVNEEILPKDEGHNMKKIWEDPVIHEALFDQIKRFKISKGLVLLDHMASAQYVVKRLQDMGLNAEVVSSYLKSLSIPIEPKILVASALLSRGLDIPDLECVFLVGAAKTENDYLHSAGRTGRMGKPGKIITLVRNMGEVQKMKKIFQNLKISLKQD